MKLVVRFGLAIGCLAGLNLPASGVDLIVKSRMVAPGDTALLPVSVRTISTKALWGIDFALFVDKDAGPTGEAYVQFPFRKQAFTPAVALKNKDFHVCYRKGFRDPKEGLEKPDLYVCMVKYGGFSNDVLLGNLNIEVSTETPRGKVLDLAVRDFTTTLYSETRPPTPNCCIVRSGASAALAVNKKETGAESAPVVFCNRIPADLQPTDKGRCVAVPLHKVAVGVPGDVNADGRISSIDIAIITSILSGLRADCSDYELIASDVAPGDIKGLDGSSSNYGDGWITKADVDLIKKMAAQPSALSSVGKH